MTDSPSSSSPAAQYDEIAADYQRTKEAPLRRHVEAYSFMRMAGDVAGMDILDLACGDGFYSRYLRSAGANSVVGVDISAEMIALAEAIEQRDPQSIRYACADASAYVPERQCDMVTAAYLLHYAPDVNDLRQMCRRIASALNSGGRLVAINENPLQPDADDPAYTQYGFNKQFERPRGDGSRINYMMVSGREMIRFHVWYYSRETYEQVLTDAGFTDIRWVDLELSAAGIEECGDDYWQAYMSNPPVIGLQAVRV